MNFKYATRLVVLDFLNTYSFPVRDHETWSAE
jgi:hypothetical protein